LIKVQDTPGPMTRTVRDAALMLDVMVGFDAADPWTATAVVAGKPKGGSYAAGLGKENEISSARIGVVRELFGGDNEEGKAVNSVISKTLETLKEAGTTLVDIEIPNMAHYVDFTPTYGSRSLSDLNSFLKATNPPMGITVEEIVATKQYHPALDLLKDIATGPKAAAEDPLYLRRLEERDELSMLVIGIMASHNVTALAFPDAKIPAPLHTDVDKYGPLDFPTNTMLASQLRQPALSVPVGFTENGLPVGLELVGLPYAEQTVLELAYGVEQLTKARRPPVL